MRNGGKLFKKPFPRRNRFRSEHLPFQTTAFLRGHSADRVVHYVLQRRGHHAVEPLLPRPAEYGHRVGCHGLSGLPQLHGGGYGQHRVPLPHRKAELALGSGGADLARPHGRRRDHFSALEEVDAGS